MVGTWWERFPTGGLADGVTTLPPGDPAMVDMSFDGTNVHFGFGIPQGTTAEVSTLQPADAIATTVQNPGGICLFTGGFSDPPPQAELQDFTAYVESLRAALVR